MELQLDRSPSVLALVGLLFALTASAASSDRLMLEKKCHNTAVWALDIFNQVKQAPNVGLDGMLEGDETEFTFVRKWIKDGKSRDELYKHTFDNCMGTPI
jgi:hypothetical protein